MDNKPIFIIISLIVIFSLEGIFPYYPGRKDRVRHALPHIATACLNGLLTKFVLAGLTISAIQWGRPFSFDFLSKISLSMFSKTVIVFVAFDLWMYFWHRVNHEIDFFWRFHRAHHTDIEMDTTTALRFHPGELILSSFARMPAIILLGMNLGQVVLFETLLNLSTLFHHSNLGIPEKWDRLLRTVIVTPNMHRVHHSVIMEDKNSNYTSFLSIWDRLFQTFKTSEDTRLITLGLPSFREPVWQRFWGFIRIPAQ